MRVFIRKNFQREKGKRERNRERRGESDIHDNFHSREHSARARKKGEKWWKERVTFMITFI